MPIAVVDDPILKRFRAALDALYGDRIERVVLFGSRARGDARKGSDYDVAVFLKSPARLADDRRRLADLETDILYDTGAVINSLPFPAEFIENAPASCMNCDATGSICDAGDGRLSL